jgi:hypothetical protein
LLLSLGAYLWQEWCRQLQLFFNNGGCQSQWLVSSICCTLMATNPTITPFAIYVGQLSSCFFSTGLHLACSFLKLIILRASPAKFTDTCHIFQSPESPKHTFSHTKGSLQQDGLSYHI